MNRLLRGMCLIHNVGEVRLQAFFEDLQQIGMQRRLVFFHGQYIVRVLIANCLDDFRLATHHVDSHGASLEVQYSQQFRDRCDLVGLLRAGDLTERQAILAGDLSI